MQDIAKVIQLDPKCAPAYFMRGATKESQGDLRGALTDCNHAITLEPNGDPAPYVQRAIVEYKMRMFNECIRDCSVVLKRDPNSLMAYKYRAQAKVQLDRHEDAVSDINSYLKLAPNDEAAKEFKNRLMAELRPTAKDDAEVKAGYDAGGKAPTIKVEHKLQTFVHRNHSIQLIPPLNFTLQKEAMPLGDSVGYFFTSQTHPTGRSAVLQASIIIPPAGGPPLDEKTLSDVIMRPFKQHLTDYTEKEGQFMLGAKPCSGLYFDGKVGGIYGHKGFICVTKNNGALFMFFGGDDSQYFDKSMRIFTDTLKTCTIK